MSTRQGNLKNFNGDKVVPNTITAAVYDAARQQALSATLELLLEHAAVGYPAFSTVTDYDAGDVVVHGGKLWKFTADHDAGAWNSAQVEAYTIRQLIADSTPEIASLAENLKTWADRDSLSVEDTWSDAVRTTAGDQSIESSGGAKLLSIVAKTNFYASALKASGFNLLHGATAVGNGYYFLVPALPFGSYGTALQPNGVLFTSAAGANLTPTVRFKAIASGVPASASDGDACAYTDSNGKRFYTTDSPGYIIVTGITLADTCAHIAWSRRYDDYVSPTDAQDAGSTISIASIIHAVHTYDLLLKVGDTADRIDFGNAAATWTRNCDRVKPTWATVDNGDDTYTHTATISTMKRNAPVVCGALDIAVDGTTLSYTDANAAATDDWVFFQLATPATGTVSISPSYAVEDFGLEYLEGATGEAFITTSYAQGYPDSLAALISSMDNKTVPVISAAFAALDRRIAAIEQILTDAWQRIDLSVATLDAEKFLRYGVPAVLESSTAGAPSAANVPDNWDDDTMGTWAGFPLFVGQEYIDKVNRKIYKAYTVTGSTGNWVALN